MHRSGGCSGRSPLSRASSAPPAGWRVALDPLDDARLVALQDVLMVDEHKVIVAQRHHAAVRAHAIPGGAAVGRAALAWEDSRVRARVATIARATIACEPCAQRVDRPGHRREPRSAGAAVVAHRRPLRVQLDEAKVLVARVGADRAGRPETDCAVLGPAGVAAPAPPTAELGDLRVAHFAACARFHCVHESSGPLCKRW